MDGAHAPLLTAAREAVRQAGAVILDIYAAGFEVRSKSDASPVTRADEESEAVILKVLTEAAPEIPVVAEEHVERHGPPSDAPRRFWLVDPLDGTKEFVRRNGEFTINIGLVENGRPTLGVVYAPALGLTFWADGPGSAMRQAGHEPPQPIQVRATPPEGLTVVHSRSHANEAALGSYLKDLPVVDRRISGSAIKFCLIASGEADLYPRFGPTMEWDTAAGQAVLEAAGGTVTTADGGPFRYGKPGFRNPAFIARGRTAG